MDREINWPMILIGVGSAIFMIGEVWGGLRNKQDNKGLPVIDTFSQWYDRQPGWIQHLITWSNGAVCSHLWKWTIAAATAPK